MLTGVARKDLMLTGVARKDLTLTDLTQAMSSRERPAWLAAA